MKLNFNIQNPSFTAGKVKLYTDFDGTYFPTSRSALRRGEDIDLMKKYSFNMEQFLKSTKGDLDFHITTGRDFESFKSVSEFLKEKGLSLPYPQSFITSNGSCEYIKSASDVQASFPFSTKLVNKSKIKGESKLVDTVRALENILAENDLLIVAGNSSNDLKMLNPLEYIKKEEWETFKSKSKAKQFYESDMNKKLSNLKEVFEGKNPELKKQLEADGLLKKIEDLPLKSIVVKSEKTDLNILIEAFGSTGKVISIEKGKLDNGIKQAVKSYADSKDAYKQAMSDKFKDVIYKTGKNNKFANLVIPFAGLFLAGLMMFMHYSKIGRSLNKEK